MKRWLMVLAMFVACSAALRADVTIVQTTTIEGGMAAMTGQTISPTTTTRIKGLKSRSDVDSEMIQFSLIADLEAKQVIALDPAQKTARILQPTPAGGAVKDSASGVAGPALDSIKPTGRSQVIDGFKCDEYTFSTTLNMSEMNPTGSTMPPEAKEMMKGLSINVNASMWVARDVPGAAEYSAFQKAAAGSDLASLISGGSGMPMPGVDRMLKAIGGLNGVAYLTEMTMTIQGTGQMADMMQQAGPMHITSKVKSISADSIPDDAFKVPQGYTVVKQ
jgi:hypothetical protein